MNAPRVSVLMAAYNARPFLPAAIDSVLQQTLCDFELIVVDDGSTDDTLDYLGEIDDPRIHIVTQQNAGLASALNRGLLDCRGGYVARMDADDVSLPERLATQADFLDSHPEVGCVGTQVAPFGESSVGGDLRLPTTHEAIHPALQEGRHAIVHASVMMRTDLVRRLGGYWSLNLVAEDYDLFLRLAEVAQLATVDRVLYHVRYHMASLNGSGMLRMRRAVDYACDRARRRHAALPPISFDEFVAARQSAPAWSRIAEAVDAHARAQYRAAVAEFCGGHRIRGYSRLAWAAACAPSLTVRRIARVLKPTLSNPTGRSNTTSHASA